MLLGIPMVLMYRLSALTYLIARALVRIPFIGIPNILAGRAIVPELIQHQATPKNLADAACGLLKDAARLKDMRGELLRLRTSLEMGGTARAADEILGILRPTS
jgi:lipid-A-disaccharide synthase